MRSRGRAFAFGRDSLDVAAPWSAMIDLAAHRGHGAEIRAIPAINVAHPPEWSRQRSRLRHEALSRPVATLRRSSAP